MSDKPNTFLADVKMPDGKVHQFEVPVGMSPADIEQNAYQAFMQANKSVESPLYEAKTPSMGNVLKQSAIKAMANPIDLIAGTPQTLENLKEASLNIKNYQGTDK